MVNCLKELLHIGIIVSKLIGVGGSLLGIIAHLINVY